MRAFRRRSTTRSSRLRIASSAMTVEPEEIIAPHFRQSARRAGAAEQVIVAHDTTQFEFGGRRRSDEAFGRLIKPSAQGFFGHFSLAIAADGARQPLGLLGAARRSFASGKSRRRGRTGQPSDNRGESADGELRRRAERLLDGRAGDPRDGPRRPTRTRLLAALHEAQSLVRDPFIPRSRLVDSDDETAAATAKAATRLVRARSAALAATQDRWPQRRSTSGPPLHGSQSLVSPQPRRTTAHQRRRRSAARRRSRSTSSTSPSRHRRAASRRSSGSCSPILPVDTPDAIGFAVDCYRARWTIEEYFKALKTGCGYEKRQLESAHSLLNALAILAPVAWRLLLLRHLARSDERRACDEALTRRSSMYCALSRRSRYPSSRRPRKPCSPSPSSAAISRTTVTQAGSCSAAASTTCSSWRWAGVREATPRSDQS